MFAHRWIVALSVGLLVGLSAGCAGSGAAGMERPGARDGTVRAEDIDRTPTQSLAHLLVGNVAGVDVTNTANGIAVRIRGGISTHGHTGPLYVLDGMPIQPGPAGELAGLSAREIASIRVLKDAADLTEYGARGANGVVVVTTKQPDR